MGRKETQTENERLAQRLEIVGLHACIDHIHENRRDLRLAVQCVLNRRVLGEELGRQVGGANVLVVRREWIPRQAKRADPQLSTHIHLAVRVQHGAARRLAHDRLVQHRRQVLPLLQRRVQCSHWNDRARGLQLCCWPHVPRETHTIAVLNLVDVHCRARMITRQRRSV